MPEKRLFSYTKWSGRERNVTADRVTFEPSGHVAFWLGSRLVVAEKREDCGNIFEHVPDVEIRRHEG